LKFDNSKTPSELVAEGNTNEDIEIKNMSTFTIIKEQAKNDKKR
jgi:hypothetical protein